MKTLITDFSNHPKWCKKSKGIKEFKGIKLGQIVLDGNNTLARVLHIQIIDQCGFFRLSLIRASGEYASVTGIFDSITVYNGEEIILQPKNI